MTERKRIPFEELKHGGCYRISSRNLILGIYDENAKGYIGIREKFGDEYLFTEFDWDTGPPFGTATPYEFIGMLPADITVAENVDAIATAEIIGNYISCSYKIGDRIGIENKQLFDWLADTASKIPWPKVE